MDVKLPYGLKDGNIVTIDDVENGLACNCVCPNCKSKLLARHGEKRVHHFSHYKNYDCGWKGESVIHKISKEIIAKHKYLRLPKLKWHHKPEIIIYDEITIPVDNVKLEYKIDKIIPDILIETKGKELMVEIKVSHGIDYDKYQKIKKLNISTIEIDVRELVNNLFHKKDYFLTSNEFADALVNGISNKYWIFNTEKERLRNIFRNQHSERLIIENLKSNYWEYSEFSYVDACPIIKRTWKSGYRKGESYAKVLDDCRLCKYYLGKDLWEIKGAKTGIVFDKKNAIYCIGHLSQKTEYEIKAIIFNNQKKLNYNTKHNNV